MKRGNMKKRIKRRNAWAVAAHFKNNAGLSNRDKSKYRRKGRKSNNYLNDM